MSNLYLIKIPNHIKLKYFYTKKQIIIINNNCSLSFDFKIIFLKKFNFLIIKKNYNNFYYYNLLNNYIKIINKKTRKIIFIKGIGFKAFKENFKLKLSVGYSHIITMNIPLNIELYIYKNMILLKSYNKSFLNNFIGILKNYKKFNIYKGTGLVISDELKILKKMKKKK